jgi:hypothetical protein
MMFDQMFVVPSVSSRKGEQQKEDKCFGSDKDQRTVAEQFLLPSYIHPNGRVLKLSGPESGSLSN